MKILLSFSIILLTFYILHSASSASLCDSLESLSRDKISKKCLKQMRVVCGNSSLSWQIMNASSKFLTSGMSYSNVADFGNFPECVSIEHEEPDGERILGKYCGFGVFIVNVFLTSEPPAIVPDFELFGNKTQWAPRDVLLVEVPFVISKYSVCVPDACTPREVDKFFIFGYLENLSIIYTDLPCETKNSNTNLESGDIAFIIFIICILALIILSTCYDVLIRSEGTKRYVVDFPENIKPLLLAFSVLKNGKKLLAISNNKTEQIECFNGMRFISMMWIVAYHADIVLSSGFYPVINYADTEKWKNNWTSQYIFSALIAVDTFFFISGCVLAFTYLKKETENSASEQMKKIPKTYLHRYLRLTPSVGAMYFVVITVYRFLGSGPLWTYITTAQSDTCKRRWWQFFLYIQNYTNQDDMCIIPTWYLSADMQIFLLAPIILIPTAVFVKKAYHSVILCLLVLTSFSTVIPIFIRYFVYEAEGNINATHDRFVDFLIGFIFGTVLRMKMNRPYIFTKLTNLILWICTITISLSFNIYWHDLYMNNALLKYTLFMGLYRPVWCLCLVFMTYSCYHNQGGIIQWLLTRPIFQIFGKLSYSMYVLHLLVEVYYAGIQATAIYFSDYVMFYHWCGNMTVTMILSIFWVLAFEFPMLTIEKYILFEKIT